MEKKTVDETLKRGYNVSIINRARLKRIALQLCSKLRPQFNRISPDFLDEFIWGMEEEIIIRLKEEIVFSQIKKHRTLK